MITSVPSNVILRLLSCLVSPVDIEPLVTVVNLNGFADDICEPSVVHAKKVGDGAKDRVVHEGRCIVNSSLTYHPSQSHAEHGDEHLHAVRAFSS